MSLASTIIKRIPFEELIGLLYLNIDTSALTLEELQGKDYRDLYRADIVATSKEATREFYQRLRVSRSQWRSIWDLLDAILVIVITRDTLVTNKEDAKKAYYWRQHGDYYQVYTYSGIDEFYTMEEAIGLLLRLGNNYPIRVEPTTIEARARAALKYLLQGESIPKAEQGNYTVDNSFALAPSPLNKLYGNLVMSEKGELVMIGRDNNRFILEGDGYHYDEERGEVILGYYINKEDISLISAVLDYNLYINREDNL